MLGSPPDAEANIAPLEDTAEGIVWVDGSVPCRALGLLDDADFGLEIVQGRIEHNSRSRAKDVETLHRLFDGSRTWRATQCAGRIPGFGLNPWATLSGRMLEDEGCAGTIHLGFGSNATIGGRNRVPFHLDFVVTQPSVWIDGIPTVRNGEIEWKAAA